MSSGRGRGGGACGSARAVLAGGKTQKEPGDRSELGVSVSLYPSLSLSSVTLEWGFLIFDPQESFPFRHSHLCHPASSHIHAPGLEPHPPFTLVPPRLLPHSRTWFRAPAGTCAELCSPTGQLGLENPPDASPAASHKPCPSEQLGPSRDQVQRAALPGAVSGGGWAFQRDWGMPARSHLTDVWRVPI